MHSYTLHKRHKGSRALHAGPVGKSLFYSLIYHNNNDMYV